MTGEPVVAIAAIEHYVYCPRQCALIHVDGVWDDNPHTVRGQRGHRRADTFAARAERGVRVVRGVPLWSEQFGLSGRADAVELHPDGAVVPVEYKVGVRHGRTAHLQLAAQAMCLEEMLGRPVARGRLWFAGPRRSEFVVIDASLREDALEVVASIRALLLGGRLPGAVDDSRCRECQLLGHCLPGVVAAPWRVDDYVATEVLSCGS